MRTNLGTSIACVGLLLTSTACGSSRRAETGQAGNRPTTELQRLFQHLPEPRLDDEGTARLVVRDGPPVPQPNHTESPFPPPDAVDAGAVPSPSDGSFSVLGYSPHNSDEYVGAVRVTFSEPMVPIETLAQQQVREAPIEITPAAPGRYRWLGTDTLVFEPDARRLPMATTYTIRLRDNATSALGHHARTAFSASFKTPALELAESIPADATDAVELRPIIALRFNQRVSEEKTLNAISIAGAPRLEIVPEGAELNRFLEEHGEMRAWDDGMWLAVRPVAALAQGRAHTLTVARGAHGAEGPDASTRASELRFRTYGAFGIESLSCLYEEDGCKPGRSPTLVLTNELAAQDAARVLEFVHFSPEVPDLTATATDRDVRLEGEFAAATTYRVTIDPALTDRFGQHMPSGTTRTLAFGDSDPWRFLDAHQLCSIELASPRVIPLELVNTDSVVLNAGPVPRDRVARVVSQLSSDANPPSEFLRRLVTLETRGARNETRRIGLDISREIPEHAPGVSVIDLPRQYYNYTLHERRLVQATDLALATVLDSRGGVVRVTSLATGAPIEGADIAVHPFGGSTPTRRAVGRTDSSGFLKFDAPLAADAYRVVVEAAKGNDAAFVETSVQRLSGDFVGAVFTDRDPYRPGDTVHLRVLARRRSSDGSARVDSLANGFAMSCTASDAFGTRVEEFQVQLNEYGTATHDIVTHDGAATGAWDVRCIDTRTPDLSLAVHGSFQLEEYRAPEIAVHVTAPTDVAFVGTRVTFAAQADYLFGAHAAGLPVTWTLGREPADFAPPGQAEFVFGDHSNWHFGPRTLGEEHLWGRSRAVFGHDQSERDVIRTGVGVLDNAGSFRVPVSLEAPDATPRNPSGAQKYVLEAVVTDTSRQATAERAELIAHTSSVYGGIHIANTMVREGQPLVSTHVVAGIDGHRLAGTAIRVRAYERRSRLTPINVGGRWVYEYTDEERQVGECVLTSALAPVECRIAPQRAGRYVIESLVRDAQRREQISRTTAYVYGQTYAPTENSGDIDITTDKEEYRVGETAHLLLRVPFAHARGLQVRERAGIVSAMPVDFVGNVQQVDVRITEADIPNFSLRFQLQSGRAAQDELNAILAAAPPGAREDLGADLGRPQSASGSVNLRVDPAPKTLRVAVRTNRPTIEPGGRLGVDVTVREPNGHPANAEVAIVVVDESVLSLLHYETPNPADLLHRDATPLTSSASVTETLLRRENLQRARRTSTTNALSSLISGGIRTGGAGSLGLRGTGRGGGGAGEGTIGLGMIGTLGRGAGSGGDFGGGAPTNARQNRDASPSTGFAEPTHARSLFATTAFFRGNVRTDANGRAHVDIEMPENLTTFRVMAIAVGRDDHSGSGEAKVRVQKSVVLRPALPRFATYGDRFNAGVVVHNETGRNGDFVVGIRSAGFVIENEGLARIHLARGASQLVSFPVRVDAAATTAHVQFAAATSDAADASDVAIPLVAPATAEAFATYGSIDNTAFRVPIVAPRDVIPHFGGLRVSLSSTALTGLDDAVEWLDDYPYDFCEPLASRLIGASALKEIYADGRSPEGAARAEAVARNSLLALLRLQRSGGFVSWESARRAYLDDSAWATLALVEARRAGIDVPQAAITNAIQFLARRISAPYDDVGEDGNYAGKAFAAFAIVEGGGTVEQPVVASLYTHRGDLPVYAQAWLERVLRSQRDPRADELWRNIANGAVLTASGAHFAENRVLSARLLWHSERRTDAVVLYTLLGRDANDPLVERTARALADSRVAGHWLTTHETAWALMALVHYARAKESEVPNTSVNAWLGNDFLGTTTFRGRRDTTHGTNLTMPELLARSGSARDLVIAGDGDGRIYYRIGVRYAPTNFRLPPASQGFTISRTYEPIDGPDTVRQDDNGVWHVKAESNVRVRLSIVIPDDRYDVVLDDPLPAGFEGSNLSFATTATQALSGELDERRVDFDSYFALWAFEHREIRDDRTVAVAHAAPAGVYELTYLTRATTPGTFVATAPHIEEMYSPESFGRGITESVVVEP